MATNITKMSDASFMNKSRYRYPESMDPSEPCVLFTSYRAEYNPNNKHVLPSANKSIALYMPTNITVADGLRYDNGQNWMGIVHDLAHGEGSLTEQIGGMTSGDLKALGFNYADEVAGAVLGLVGAKLGGAIGAIATGGTALGAARGYSVEKQKEDQVALNMKDYSMFKGPTLRQFPFEFTFLPRSKREAEDVLGIIKSFRQTAYPTTNGKLAYNFPEVYKIDFINSPGMIKIPEVALTSVQVTYNPNTMSFFKDKGIPVEINISLAFQELSSINAEHIEEGY